MDNQNNISKINVVLFSVRSREIITMEMQWKTQALLH